MTSHLILRVGIPELSLVRTMILDPWVPVSELHHYIFQKLDGTQQTSLQAASKSNKEHVFSFYIPKKDIWISDNDRLIKYLLKEMEIIEYKLRPRKNSPGSVFTSKPKKEKTDRKTKRGERKIKSEGSIPEEDLPSDEENFLIPGRHLISIKCMYTGTTRFIEYDNYLLVSKLINDLGTKEGIEDPINWSLNFHLKDFGIPFTLDPSSTLASYEFESGEKIYFERMWFPLTVQMENGKSVDLAVRQEWTIDKCISELITQYNLTEYKDFSLFLPPSLFGSQKSVEYSGILLEKNRTVKSYRLKLGDKLLFQSEEQFLEKHISGMIEKKNILIVINSSEHGLSKTFNLELDTTIEKIIAKFAEKCSIDRPHLFNLYYTENGSENPILMDPKEKLSSFKLNNLDTLLFQRRLAMGETGVSSPNTNRKIKVSIKKPAPGNNKSKAPPPKQLTNIVFLEDKKDSIFGADPSTLEMVNDQGNQIPKVLYDLKVCANNVDQGLRSEGIFRVAGVQDVMNEIRQNLLKNNFPSCEVEKIDVYSIVSLIKKYYTMLPIKILSHLSFEYIEECLRNQPVSIENVTWKLKEPELSLFRWLIDLCIQVVKLESENKMSAKNLGRVMSPVLWEIPLTSAEEGAKQTEMVGRFVEDILISACKASLESNNNKTSTSTEQ